MSKKNIALAILIGAAAGGIVALFLQAEKMLEREEFNEADGDYDEEDDEDEPETRFETIAKQFSERFTDLRTAESKIRSAPQRDPEFKKPDGEFGIFL